MIRVSAVALTGRVVAPVLQPLQTFDEDLKDLAPSPWHMVVEIGKDSWRKMARNIACVDLKKSSCIRRNIHVAELSMLPVFTVLAILT